MKKNYICPSTELLRIKSLGICQAVSKFEFTNGGSTTTIDPEHGGI